MRKSLIFSNCELAEIDRRKDGDKSDRFGLFSNRVRPKIKELFEWFGRLDELKKLVEVKKDGRTKKE